MGNVVNCQPLCAKRSYEQLIAVVRHGERLDAADPGLWWGTKEGKAYPFDCPLTSHGAKQAYDAGVVLKNLGCAVDLVVSSPYHRCVQTALVIARVFRAELAIDAELGEVYGPRTMGGDDANPPKRRSIEEVLEFVQSKADGVVLHKEGNSLEFLGVAPDWPETLEEARIRFVCRIETYIERSTRLRRNFILVTHGDAVAATAAILLRSCVNAVPGNTVTKVNYCGLVAAKRNLSTASQSQSIICCEAQENHEIQMVPDTQSNCELANDAAHWKATTHNLSTSVKHNFTAFSDPGSQARDHSIADEVRNVKDARAAMKEGDVERKRQRQRTSHVLQARFGGLGLDDLLQDQDDFEVDYERTLRPSMHAAS